ncbi:phage portal protein family protein [Nitrososphaera viennensis]|uniref:Portal protein n=2 Tax=Nitrososphaera viennensis TaxID=1034015 RepID=A0A977IDK3_9ARCH|nr:hypothetical protein [Nitrososphaera viennensis]AIC16939.1 putative portal encoding protein [Nitrososphaera viennensis EN76]UVS68842.1 hypothetical protein NWT39_13155 [Nitrososphaera viennensis]CBX88949.1 putative portal encoding protein [Nitrososphaera phage Pro-Nvie1]
MNLRFWRPKQEVYGVTLSEPSTNSSSQVSDYSQYQLYVRPEVDFQTCYEYYRTIGKVQNAVESYVAEILSRDWYFEGAQEGVQACEEWEDRFNLSRIIEYIVRDWLVCGNSIIGISDWQPVQISSIAGVRRSPYGIAEQFVQVVNGREVPLDASRFIHTQYIEVNREAWGIGMFHSLLTTFDYGSRKRSLPHLEIYRRQIQLFYKILERYGSPVTVWFFENVAKAEFDRQVEELRALEPGDRRILSKKVEIATETVDARGNLINATSPVINQEIEAGLQTSANRLITQPSAMADARIGSEYDDSKTTAIMEKIRRVMNVLIIPKITLARVEFKWGKKDNFEFDFNQLLQAKSAGFVSSEEGRAILQSVGWKLDDNLFNAQQQLQKQEDFRFLNERVRHIICSTLQEFNPYHDERGRFASATGATNFSVVATKRPRNSKVNINEPIIQSETPTEQHRIRARKSDTKLSQQD